MRALAIPARIRIGDKGSVKEWVKYPINGVMEQSVSDTGLVNASRLRVGNAEGLIPAMLVCFIFQLGVQEENIIKQPVLKLPHVFPPPLALYEFPPSREQIL